MESLEHDTESICRAFREIERKFNEHLNIKKVKKSTISPIFDCHVVWKRAFVISYVNVQHHQQGGGGGVGADVMNELNLDGLSDYINSDAFKNGVFIISSKYYCSFRSS